MTEDLFAAAAEDRLARHAPLAARLRPKNLDEVVGQEHLLGPGKPLRALIEADRLSSVILWGPPGTGNTTISQLIARTTSKAFEQLSAVSASVKDVREIAAGAKERLAMRGQGTILFLDEVHRFNKSQQDALLPSVESGLLVLIGATTENQFFEVNPPLLSRSTLFRLDLLSAHACGQLVDRGLTAEGATIDDDARQLLIDRIAHCGGSQVPNNNLLSVHIFELRAEVLLGARVHIFTFRIGVTSRILVLKHILVCTHKAPT